MDEKKRIRFDDAAAIHDDVQFTNGGAYRIESNDNGGWDVYVTATGEKIVDDTTSWHFDVVYGIERHLNGEASVGQWRGPGPDKSATADIENALRSVRRQLKTD